MVTLFCNWWTFITDKNLSYFALLCFQNHSYSEAQRLDVLQALTPVLVGMSIFFQYLLSSVLTFCVCHPTLTPTPVAASVHQLSTRSHPVPHPLDATVFKCFVLTAQLLTRCRGDTTGRYREHWHAIVKFAGQLIDRTHPMCTVCGCVHLQLYDLMLC